MEGNRRKFLKSALSSIAALSITPYIAEAANKVRIQRTEKLQEEPFCGGKYHLLTRPGSGEPVIQLLPGEAIDFSTYLKIKGNYEVGSRDLNMKRILKDARIDAKEIEEMIGLSVQGYPTPFTGWVRSVPQVDSVRFHVLPPLKEAYDKSPFDLNAKSPFKVVNKIQETLGCIPTSPEENKDLTDYAFRTREDVEEALKAYENDRFARGYRFVDKGMVGEAVKRWAAANPDLILGISMAYHPTHERNSASDISFFASGDTPSGYQTSTLGKTFPTGLLDVKRTLELMLNADDSLSQAHVEDLKETDAIMRATPGAINLYLDRFLTSERVVLPDQMTGINIVNDAYGGMLGQSDVKALEELAREYSLRGEQMQFYLEMSTSPEIKIARADRVLGMIRNDYTDNDNRYFNYGREGGSR